MLVGFTVLLFIAALVPLNPIRDAVDGSIVSDARLERSLAYAALGPISSVFDAMTLFTVGQIIGLTLWVVALYALARYLFYRRRRAISLVREGSYAVLALVALLIAYAAVVFLPRPMARLIVTRSDVIAVDFHSHTRYSHDGRPGWSPADVRDWHANAGYNAVYITDHATFDGAAEGVLLDTTLAGNGTLLCPGLEAFYHGEHVNILSAGVRYNGLTSADLREVDDQALAIASHIPAFEPVLVETIPGDLSKILPAHGPGTAGVRAIEIVDGSPRGMSQIRRDHARIIHLADSLNLALVAGTDNHGWGRTAAGWTLLRLPGWRGYAADGMAREIEMTVRGAGRTGTHVIERTTASATPIAVATTLPTVVWTVMRTLSSGERVAWFIWFWAVWLIVLVVRSRSAP